MDYYMVNLYADVMSDSSETNSKISRFILILFGGNVKLNCPQPNLHLMFWDNNHKRNESFCTIYTYMLNMLTFSRKYV